MEKGWINCTLLAYLHISVRVWNLNFPMAKCVYIERDASIITVSIKNKWTIILIATFYATDACEITKFNTIEGIFEMSPVKLSIIGPIYRNLWQINFIQPIKLVANFNLTQIMLNILRENTLVFLVKISHRPWATLTSSGLTNPIRCPHIRSIAL